MKRKIKMAVQAPSFRPTVAGNHYAVSTGHYLATAAAMRILDGGGNAVDAGVTAAMALPILQPDMVSFAGVAPTLIYLKKENRVISLAGLGYWPAATDINRLIKEGNGEHVPEALLRTVMPAAPATHIEALRRYKGSTPPVTLVAPLCPGVEASVSVPALLLVSEPVPEIDPPNVALNA